MRGVACAAALALAATGCPRLPPEPPRPAVVLDRIDRAAANGAGGVWLRARLRVHNRGSATLRLSAVDWELCAGNRPLLRGRAEPRRLLAPGRRAAVEVAIAVPVALDDDLRRGAAAAGGRVGLRGTVHLEDAGGRGRPAPFDELAALP